MLKKIFIFLMLIVTLNSVCYAETNKVEYTDEKTGNKIIIEDDANLLNEKEIDDLFNTMKKISEYGNVAFKSINTNSSTVNSFASSYYHNKFGTKSGTLFLIDMDNRKIYIFSDGNNYKYITNAKALTITDNVYTYASKKQYYMCANEAFIQVHTILRGEKIAEPMKNISNVIIAVMISLFANFMLFKFLSRSRATANNELIKESENYFEHTVPEVNKIGEHSEYSPISSDDSSSSGGGFSGGGGRK